MNTERGSIRINTAVDCREAKCVREVLDLLINT